MENSSSGTRVGPPMPCTQCLIPSFWKYQTPGLKRHYRMPVSLPLADARFLSVLLVASVGVCAAWSYFPPAAQQCTEVGAALGAGPARTGL